MSTVKSRNTDSVGRVYSLYNPKHMNSKLSIKKCLQ